MNEEELKRRPQEVLDEIDPLNAYRDRPWHGWAVGLRATWLRHRTIVRMKREGVDPTIIYEHWDLWILAFCKWLDAHPAIIVTDQTQTVFAMEGFLRTVRLPLA